MYMSIKVFHFNLPNVYVMEIYKSSNEVIDQFEVYCSLYKKNIQNFLIFLKRVMVKINVTNKKIKKKVKGENIGNDER